MNQTGQLFITWLFWGLLCDIPFLEWNKAHLKMTDERSGQLKTFGYFHASKIICTITILFAQYTQFGN